MQEINPAEFVFEEKIGVAGFCVVGAAHLSQVMIAGAPSYSVLKKSVAKSRLLENAIDSRMRIKTKTCSDIRQKSCRFYWRALLHITIACDFFEL